MRIWGCSRREQEVRRGRSSRVFIGLGKTVHNFCQVQGTLYQFVLRVLPCLGKKLYEMAFRRVCSPAAPHRIRLNPSGCSTVTHWLTEWVLPHIKAKRHHHFLVQITPGATVHDTLSDTGTGERNFFRYLPLNPNLDNLNSWIIPSTASCFSKRLPSESWLICMFS